MTNTTTAGKIPNHESDFAKTIADFCLRDYTAPGAEVRQGFPTDPIWQGLKSTGTTLWLDTGDIDAARERWTQEFAALTTNNTLLNKEVQKGIYDKLVPEAANALRAANPGIDEGLLIQEIAFILNAVHGLKLVSTFDADVSVELHTNLAFDTEASYQYGKRFAAICPDRFIVKVPLTPEGLVAARRLSDDGVRLNFTLGFSARQNRLIASFSRPTWVNVFMGRLNAYVKNNGIGTGENVGEKATLASQRVLLDLRARGLDVRQIGASIRNGQQCVDLMGLDVYTMPTGAADEYHEINPPAGELRSRVQDDPNVTLNDDFDVRAENLHKLWEVDDAFCAAVDSLECRADTTGDDIRAHLAANGAGDLFPTLSANDRERITRESKIPQRASWKDHVDAGTASWDGLLSESCVDELRRGPRQSRRPHSQFALILNRPYDGARTDYAEAGLPWLDRLIVEVRNYVEAIQPPPDDPEQLRLMLLHWAAFGYAVLPKAISDVMVDALLADMEELFDNHKDHRILVDTDAHHATPICDLETENLRKILNGEMRIRINDLHNYSIAARKVSLHPAISSFLQHVFGGRIAVLQSLTFFVGSEQALHQDFAFVPAQVPSQLAAAWVALEDIHPDSGPLAYIPGSHFLPKFEWGNGIFRNEESTESEIAFGQYLSNQAARMGLHEQYFCPKKGDVFIWHSALAHGGSLVRDRSRTRKSYVSHYTQAATHNYHFRRPDEVAKQIEFPTGVLLQNPLDPAGADTLRNGEHL